MARILPVTDWEVPLLAPFKSMRWQTGHREQGIFVAEGEKVARRLLESPLEVLTVLAPPKWIESYAELLARRPEPDLIAYFAEKEAIEAFTGFDMYQGVLALGRVPPRITLEQVLKKNGSEPALIAAVEGIASADNIGAVVRNCAAFGAHALLVGETSCSPYLRRSVRASMGTIYKLPIIEAPSLVEALRQAADLGLAVIAAHPREDSKALAEADLARPCLIILGSEGQGLSESVLAACAETVAIPMAHAVDSLNVAAAAAVFFYEAARQRASKAVCAFDSLSESP